MGSIISEALSPGYHVMQMIRDLGVGTAALIFNISVVVFGVLLTAAACLLRRGGPLPGFLHSWH
ncbi:hypothetical protein [Methanoregula sp.]|uniref:hypothetical protein n=1 Tax=Methanoregula sp. TaxID=2052170 RepID=UPI003562FF71